jgi:positive regulator of sigma E activity
MDRGWWPVAVIPFYSYLSLVIFVAVVVIADIVFAAERQRHILMPALKKKSQTLVLYYNAALKKKAKRQHSIIMPLLKKKPTASTVL